MFYLKDPTINYKSRRPTSKRPSNCMYKREVWDSITDTQKYLLVVDYYTPRRRGRKLKAGWWLALRRPGYVPRTKPQLVLFLKEGYDCPDLEMIEETIKHIF